MRIYSSSTHSSTFGLLVVTFSFVVATTFGTDVPLVAVPQQASSLLKNGDVGTEEILRSNGTKTTTSEQVNDSPRTSTATTTTTPTTTNLMMTVTIPQPDPDIVGYPVSRYAPDRRTYDMVETVRDIHQPQNHINTTTTNNNTTNPLGVSHTEWKARTELAAAYRGLYLLGLDKGEGLGSDQAAQCLMMRVPSSSSAAQDETTTTTFLIADWGVWFEEVTASSLLKITTDGTILHPDGSITTGSDPLMANTGCIPVAKAIFETRPDVNVIVHIHPYAVMAVGGLQVGLLPLSQAAFFLWGQVSRETYDFTYEASFETTLATGFHNGQRAMILNHHGMYAVGRDAAEAIFVATHLTQACEVQVRTLSMVGGDLSKVLLPNGNDLSQQYRDMMGSTDYSYDGSREWPGFIRRVQRHAPDYNT